LGLQIMLKNKLHIPILSILLFPAFFCTAQNNDIVKYKQKFPGESKIILEFRNEISINYAGDSLKAELKRHEEALCLDNNAIMQADQSLTYSGNFNISSLTAKTLVPFKAKYKAFDVMEFDTSDYREPSIFYDDVKQISFKYPKLTEGARTLLDYTYKIGDLHLLNPFYINYYLPVERAEISVTFPKDVEIGYKLFNCDSLKINFTKEQKGGKTTYKWTANNIPKLQIEPNAPELAYYAAHLFVFIKEYKTNDKTVKVLSDINDLFAWYQDFVRDVNVKPAPILKTFVDSLLMGTTGELEKVKKVLYWVQDHIKYIAFEAGRDGFVPRNGELVYIRRYGDCKDMASIITKMLNLAGINCYLTWIGTRHIPYTYEELPLPSVDNHMIACYKAGDKYYFLDATTGPHPFGYPSSMIQGKEALINIDKDQFEIIKVPEISPELNYEIDTLRIKINGKKIIGTGSSYFKGYSRYNMYHLIGMKDKTQQTTILKNYFEKGNNKFLIDNFTIHNLNDQDKDLIITYSFNLADYAQILGDEIFINMNMEKINLGDAIKKERTVPLEKEYKKTTINHVILDIPEGYKVTYLPDNTEYSGKSYGYKIHYKTEGNKLNLTHQFDTKFLLLQPSEFDDWNKMNESLKQAYKESINLTKVNTPK
jgi:transglutaminase-like putative cysteine protease